SHSSLCPAPSLSLSPSLPLSLSLPHALSLFFIPSFSSHSLLFLSLSLRFSSSVTLILPPLLFIPRSLRPSHPPLQLPGGSDILCVCVCVCFACVCVCVTVGLFSTKQSASQPE